MGRPALSQPTTETPTTSPHHSSAASLTSDFETQGLEGLLHLGAHSPLTLRPKALRDSSTLALSFFLMKPLSTWTAITWSSFSALCSSAAQTVESTPPLSSICRTKHRSSFEDYSFEDQCHLHAKAIGELETWANMVSIHERRVGVGKWGWCGCLCVCAHLYVESLGTRFCTLKRP